MNNQERKLQRQIKGLLLFFIIALIISGITAFPLEAELRIINGWCQNHLSSNSAIRSWIEYVYSGIRKSYALYPFIGYGTDWLAFSHIIIAMFFWGPLKSPVENKWVIKIGMIACVLVIPMAFIAGSIRQIPVFWELIDCSFGIFGFIPLYLTLKLINKLSHIREEKYKTQLLNQKGRVA